MIELKLGKEEILSELETEIARHVQKWIRHQSEQFHDKRWRDLEAANEVRFRATPGESLTDRLKSALREYAAYSFTQRNGDKNALLTGYSNELDKLLKQAHVLEEKITKEIARELIKGLRITSQQKKD